ncbi:MAG: DUF4392 domain-containing protein [Clostridiales bacterium]|jgi:hypothetical protein|nr:DUF4392 domain-containing protein [Clostridiales bacterium]
MTQSELTKLNIGQNLDNLMNLDPRGYGVCRILYKAAREYTKKPLTVNAAEKLIELVKDGDIVYIITGFVLLSHKKAEMDGIVGAVLLARALVKAFNAKPVIVCPEDNLKAVENLANVAGLHLYKSIDELKEYPVSMGVITFTKDAKEAVKQADEILKKAKPPVLISTEAPGANKRGVYHNATGLNVTDLEAKADVFFKAAAKAGIPTIAVGDLGNEIGMGAIAPHLYKYIPYAAEGRCRCGCGGGIAADSAADHIITATVSDWGVNALIAALAFLTGKSDVLHSNDDQKRAIYTASESGMIDMHGWLIPAIDGFDLSINLAILSLMRECIEYAPKLKDSCKTWFDKTIELGFFDENK